ncbi:hypothetical protein MTO96_023194 [Rhipicephalus appendiculatus]
MEATGTWVPGINPLRDGDPVDEDDAIAKSHDEVYERAKSHVDVFAADQASAALLNDFRRTVYGLSSVGLNHSIDTGICRVKKGETNNPMKQQSYTAFQLKDHSDMAKSYWGLKITPGNEDKDGDDEKSIPSCRGVPRHNFAYDIIHIEKASPSLTKFVNQFPFKGHVGTPIINYEYQFGTDAWLKTGPTYNADAYAPVDYGSAAVTKLDNKTHPPLRIEARSPASVTPTTSSSDACAHVNYGSAAVKKLDNKTHPPLRIEARSPVAVTPTTSSSG